MASATTVRNTREGQLGPALLVILMVLYALAVLLKLAAVPIPLPFIVGPQILAPALFALIHGSRIYAWRGVIVFATICFAVCQVVENIGVLTGFPFGTYFFTDAMGPKLFHVPLAMGLAYLAIGYSCWTVALLILNRAGSALTKTNIFAVPALAACIMVAWDFCSEPAWSTVLHFWIWPHGGAYFGVPYSNFAGWFLPVFTIFQTFAIFLSKQPFVGARVPQTYWRLAVLSYVVAIASNIVSAIALFRLPPISDPAGTMWNASSLATTSILISLFLMGGFALLAWSKLSGYSRAYENAQV